MKDGRCSPPTGLGAKAGQCRNDDEDISGGAPPAAMAWCMVELQWLVSLFCFIKKQKYTKKFSNVG